MCEMLYGRAAAVQDFRPTFSLIHDNIPPSGGLFMWAVEGSLEVGAVHRLVASSPPFLTSCILYTFVETRHA